jgi:hypothetical protein
MSVNDINDFQDRVSQGELVVNNTHPNYGELDLAIKNFNDESKYSVVPSPDTIRSTLNAISMATMRGVITPRREDLEKLARKIIDKKVTEHDIDRVQGDSGAKKYLRGLWNKLVDKSQNELVETLFSAIRTQGVPLAILLAELAK